MPGDVDLDEDLDRRRAHDYRAREKWACIVRRSTAVLPFRVFPQ